MATLSAGNVDGGALNAGTLSVGATEAGHRVPDIGRARRLVIKIGSALLVEPGGTLRHAWLESVAADIARLRARGTEVIVVSSGAIALARMSLPLPQRPLRLEEKQAAAAIGQIRLAQAWTEALSAHGLIVAQLLLTIEDSEDRRRYLFVAIDRATRWVFVRIYPAQTAANARKFLRDLERAAPMKITRVLTDNGKAFTDRLFGLRRRAATGNHEFDRLCDDLGIERRLAPPMHPQTNGMVERFNGRIEDILQRHRFRSGEDLEQTIRRYVRLYKGQLPQSVLKGRTPIDALKVWHHERPELFRKQPYNHTGCDS